MKKLCWFIILGFTSLNLYSQVPQSFNYQAVARTNTGIPMANEILSVLISIHSASATGTVVYSEQHNVTTDDYGLFSLAIGTGSSAVGTFTTIPWGSNSYFLEVGIDNNGGMGFVSMGTTQLLSVPYAMYAQKTAPPQLGYQVMNSPIPVTNVRNADVFTPDSLIVAESGTYFIVYEAYGIDEHFGAYSDPDMDNVGQTFPYNVTLGAAMMNPLYFTHIEQYYNGPILNQYFSSNRVSKTKIEFLFSGTVLKGVARIDATGSPTSNWFLPDVRITLIKIGP